MSPFTGLVFPHHAGFLNLQIRTDGLLELWPALPGTRKRGRPSSKELIVAEARNRAASGLTLLTVAAEARHLASWLLASHPDADSHPEPKTIQGHISQIFPKPPKSGNL